METGGLGAPPPFGGGASWLLVLKEPDGLVDCVDDTFEVVFDFLIAEAQHGDAEGCEYGVAFGVLCEIMHRAVDFDGKFQRYAEVIGEV